jgi:hypothetical protein
MKKAWIETKGINPNLSTPDQKNLRRGRKCAPLPPRQPLASDVAGIAKSGGEYLHIFSPLTPISGIARCRGQTCNSEGLGGRRRGGVWADPLGGGPKRPFPEAAQAILVASGSGCLFGSSESGSTAARLEAGSRRAHIGH